MREEGSSWGFSMNVCGHRLSTPRAPFVHTPARTGTVFQANRLVLWLMPTLQTGFLVFFLVDGALQFHGPAPESVQMTFR